MDKIMNKTVKILIALFLFLMMQPVFAKENATVHINRAVKLFDKGLYTASIAEYSKAIKISSNDTAANNGIILAYTSRAKGYLNENEYGKAANDYRSILFYSPELVEIKKALKFCENKLGFKNTSKNHYYTAKLLDVAGESAAAAYEYTQAAKYIKTLEKHEDKNNSAGKN